MTKMMKSSLTSSELIASLDLIEIKPGMKFSRKVLQDFLPDTTTALFFGKVYELDYVQLSALLKTVLTSDLAQVLFAGDHSTDLQSYVVDMVDEYGDEVLQRAVHNGDIGFSKAAAPPKGEILPALWASMETDIAQSIKQVAEKLSTAVAHMPGKQGRMLFANLMKLNLRRPVIGDYRAKVHHDPVKDNLVVLDVSGSMNETTIRRIVEDVVALSYAANAHMAIVSNTTTHWEPGSYGVDEILRAAEYGGTYYETLQPLFEKDWGVVVSIADYDSSLSAKQSLARAKGSIDTLLDISLVNRPTFLAECLGQFADEVRPLLIAQSQHVLSN